VYEHLCAEMNSISDIKLKLQEATQDAVASEVRNQARYGFGN